MTDEENKICYSGKCNCDNCKYRPDCEDMLKGLIEEGFFVVVGPKTIQWSGNITKTT